MSVAVLAAGGESGLPAPCRAGTELADMQTVRALGIPFKDVEHARLVLCLLSRFLGRGRAESRSHLYAMMVGVTVCCTIEVAHDGELDPAPHPELSGVAWPHGSSVFKRLGIDAETLDSYWLQARNRASDACFPIEWVTVFFPPVLWPAVLTLVRWGPERARVRLEQATMAMAQMTTQRETRRRPKGSPLAFGTINAWVMAVMGLLEEVVSLRSQVKASKNPALPPALLSPWVAAPRRPNLSQAGAKPSGQDNSGPALEDVRQRLQELARDYEAHPEFPYLRLRRLLLLSLCALLGPRADALRTLDVDDFVPDAPGPDGVRRDALELRPGKTWARGEVHRLPLPAEIAGWLREWIRITGREIGQPDTPLFPHKRPKPGIALTYLSQPGFYCAIAGRQYEDGSGQRALVPLNGDAYVGYRAHGLRHSSEQLVQRAAVELKAANPGRFDHYTPDDFARALLGHALVRTVSDVYRDVDRAKLSYQVVDKAWQILWGEGTAWLGIDPYAVKNTRERVETLRAALAAVAGEQHRLIRQQEQLAATATTLTGDKLLQAHIESNSIAARIANYTRKLDELHAGLARAEQASERARTERVPLPDDLSEEQYAKLLEQALAHAVETEAELNGPLADQLSPSDLADLYGVTEQTINRWHRTGFPACKPAYWQADAWVINGPRTKTLSVEAINQELLTEAQRQRLLQLHHYRAASNGV